MVGAAAEIGTPLSALKAFGGDVNRRTRSMGMALMPCTVPTGGRLNFRLADDVMEMGVGIHGEPGGCRWLPPTRLPTSSFTILRDLTPKQVLLGNRWAQRRFFRVRAP